MNVKSIMEDVTRCVWIQLDHIFVLVVMDTHWIQMEEDAQVHTFTSYTITVRFTPSDTSPFTVYRG